MDAVVLWTLAGFAAFVACLFFVIPAQADEIEVEPAPPSGLDWLTGYLTEF
jgi:hypothetical protein